jgi:hypothetical protein
MTDQSSISAGYNTARVSSSVADEERRRHGRLKARGEMAAMVVDRRGGLDDVQADDEVLRLVAAEFATLCEALGLDVIPEHLPGVCRHCRGQIPIRAAMRGDDWTRKGFCRLRCMREAVC